MTNQGLETPSDRFSDSESVRGLQAGHYRPQSPSAPGRSHSADSSFLGPGDHGVTPREVARRQEQARRPDQGLGRRVELGQGQELALGGEQLSSFLSQNLSELRQSIKLHQARRHNIDVSSAEAKCLVGYLGTIEMPEGVGREGGLQEIRNCIRRLRVEKKVHTLVLLCIFPARILLINHHGLKLAEFPAENIRFCGVYADDKRFFGLVTSQQREGEGAVSSSCHVFMVEPVVSEQERQQRAATFNFSPSPGAGGGWAEFPSDADPILRVIYLLRGLDPEGPAAAAEQVVVLDVMSDCCAQASTTSSSLASNSDSGIGGRDTEASLPQVSHLDSENSLMSFVLHILSCILCKGRHPCKKSA